MNYRVTKGLDAGPVLMAVVGEFPTMEAAMNCAAFVMRDYFGGAVFDIISEPDGANVDMIAYSATRSIVVSIDAPKGGA